jgi:hypothetical protein
MSIKEIAEDFTALCKAGEFEEAGKKYWAETVRSIEAMDGPMQVADGLQAVLAKGEWWYTNHDVAGVEVTGPYVNGDQFALRFQMKVRPMGSTDPHQEMDEVGVYTVADGKIVEERFFYA